METKENGCVLRQVVEEKMEYTRGEGSVLCLDFAGCSYSVYSCQNSLNCLLYIDAVHCI